jgi:glycosyltransferase involved in cell wall biosynthesis
VPNVLVLTPSLTGTPGGITRYARSLVQSEVLARRGFAVTPVATHTKGAAVRKVLFAASAAARVLLERPRHPITHALIASHASAIRKLALLAESRAVGARTIAHFQASSVIEWLTALPSWRRSRVFATLGSLDLVVTLGDRLADYFRRSGVRTRVHVIPNGVPTAPPRPERVPGAPRYVLAAGELGERKGTLELLDAFARVRTGRPDVSLVLAGDGEVDRARRRAQELGIADAVRFPGWVDPPRLAALLAGAELFILPSHREGMSFAVLEALMQGTPVVATPVGEQASVITDRETGLLVQPGDIAGIARALEELLADPALADALGRAGRLRAQTAYTLNANHEAVADLYDELLSRRKASDAHNK